MYTRAGDVDDFRSRSKTLDEKQLVNKLIKDTDTSSFDKSDLLNFSAVDGLNDVIDEKSDTTAKSNEKMDV